MIYVICDNYDQAVSAFNDFAGWLDIVEPNGSFEIDEYSNTVKDLDCEVDYIFIDHRYLDLLNPEVCNDDIIDVYEFFSEDMIQQAQDLDPTFWTLTVLA